MTEERDEVVLMTARSAFEAEVVVSLLQAEGIQAIGGLDSRWDEFASVQRVLNLTGLEILVAAEDRERAAAIVAAARAAGGELAAEYPDEDA